MPAETMQQAANHGIEDAGVSSSKSYAGGDAGAWHVLLGVWPLMAGPGDFRE